MKIATTDSFIKNQSVAAAKPKGELVELSGEASSIDEFLRGDDYSSIDPRTSAGMLGFFTQKMQSQGFPWRLFAPAAEEGGEPTRVSDFEAWARLQKGKPVIFQPMRNLQMDLGAENWGAIAAAGSLSTTPESTNLTNFAKLTKDSKVSPGSLGIELRHGESILVKDSAELKLLYQLYDPQAEIATDNRVSKAANQLSFFTQPNPSNVWRFYEETDTNRVGRMGKAFLQDGGRAALIGAAVGAGFGAVLGLVTRNLNVALTSVGVGAAAFATINGAQAATAAAKGQPLNAVQALNKVLNDEEVVFQKVNRRSTAVPFFKDISWFSDNGPGNRVSSLEDLETLSWMYNSPEPQKPADKT